MKEPMPRVGFTITRSVDASPSRVWAMWTDPSELVHWLHPAGATTMADSIDFDVRPGGRLRYTLVERDTGSEYPIAGEFSQVEPPRRLVFTWGSQDQVDTGDAAIITVTLQPEERGTLLTLEVRGIPGQPGDGYYFDRWAEALDNLLMAGAD